MKLKFENLVDKHLDSLVISVMHLLFFLGLAIAVFLMGNEAKAENNQPVCVGNNLLEELSDDELATARSEAAKIPNGQGLLWQISKPGQKSSWLYGTMHLTDPRIVNLSGSVGDAIDSSDVVVIETLDLLDPQKASAAMLMNPDLTMFSGGKTLASELSPEDKELVEVELNERGISFNLVSGMKPWMIMSLVGASDCETERTAKGVRILDFQIVDRAKAGDKELKGLETIVEQLSAMASLPIDFQVKGLIETLRLGDLTTDIIETMIQLYLSEEISLITPAMQAIATKYDAADTDEDGFGEFEAKIVLARNYIMAERSLPILEKGNAFIAVGALHLPGEEGVIELLREHGYEITRVE